MMMNLLFIRLLLGWFEGRSAAVTVRHDHSDAFLFFMMNLLFVRLLGWFEGRSASVSAVHQIHNVLFIFLFQLFSPLFSVSFSSFLFLVSFFSVYFL